MIELSSARILLVDHHDSFSLNLLALLRSAGANVSHVQSEQLGDLDEVVRSVDGVVLSPGPGHPSEYAHSLELCIKLAESEMPVLGVCLGHQLLLYSTGAEINVGIDHPVHGRRVMPFHPLAFSQLPGLKLSGPFVMYNSLCSHSADPVYEEQWNVVAEENGQVLAVEHKTLPHFGVQFHPESFGSPGGSFLISAFVRRVRELL